MLRRDLVDQFSYLRGDGHVSLKAAWVDSVIWSRSSTVLMVPFNQIAVLLAASAARMARVPNLTRHHGEAWPQPLRPKAASTAALRAKEVSLEGQFRRVIVLMILPVSSLDKNW